MGKESDHKCPGDCPGEGNVNCQENFHQQYPVNNEAEARWLESELGDCQIIIGTLNETIQGFEKYVGQADMPKCEITCTVCLGKEYSEEDAYEIAHMMGSVIRSWYVRTRLYPLIALPNDGRQN